MSAICTIGFVLICSMENSSPTPRRRPLAAISSTSSAEHLINRLLVMHRNDKWHLSLVSSDALAQSRGALWFNKGNEAAGYTPKIAKHCNYIWCEFPGPRHRGVAGRYFASSGILWQGMGGCAYDTGWSGWGLLKDERRLTYEMACYLSHGGMISTGIQPMPRLALDALLYDTIGAAFGFAMERKEYILGARPRADIAVLASESSKHLRYSAPSLLGATVALAEHHFLFDVIGSSSVDNLDRYKIVVTTRVVSRTGSLWIQHLRLHSTVSWRAEGS